MVLFLKNTSENRDVFRCFALPDGDIFIEVTRTGSVLSSEHIIIFKNEIEKFPELNFLPEGKHGNQNP